MVNTKLSEVFLIIFAIIILIINNNIGNTHASAHMQQMEGWVPRTDAALPLWTATDRLWRRYLNELSPPVVSLRRLPRSLKNHRVSRPQLQAPDDSIAMGVNE